MSENNTTTTEILHFYTVGDGFTRLLKTFYDEGRFSTVEKILKDGGMPEEMIVLFFCGCITFEGDTRTGDHALDVVVLEQPEDFDEILYWATINAAGSTSKLLQALCSKTPTKDFKALYRYIPREEVVSRLWKRIVGRHYPINPEPATFNGSGVILQSGDLIECGYMGHNALYSDLLAPLGLSDSIQWTDDSKNFHVSSFSLSGTIANAMQNLASYGDSYEDVLPTEAQIETLFRYRERIEGFYAAFERKNLVDVIRRYTGERINHGGKFNNLSFLKRFYPEIRLPKFDKVFMTDVEVQAVRTSPKYSIAGLLESKFGIQIARDYYAAIQEIEARFEQFKHVRKDNELFTFCQEYIAGKNGVAHIIDRRGIDGGPVFSYAVSDKQGAVVQGKKGEAHLSSTTHNELQRICERLQRDLNKSIQVEFVVSEDNTLYIVQLRTLENSAENTVGYQKPQNILAAGKTFSKGWLTDVAVEDVLIVEEDCDSALLLGKKAVIVKANVEFSHILALSQALAIPSIYATGNFDLQGRNKISLQAQNTDAYVYFS